MKSFVFVLGPVFFLAGASNAGTVEGAPAVIPCEIASSGTACIPGGPFLRGSDDGPPHARPKSRVWVQTFYMDVHEVTYGAYEQCVAQGKCDRAGPNYSDFDAPNQPITGISWYDAVKFCKAMGKHLPTEAQWEKAARGTEGSIYPWGDEPATCQLMVYKNEKGRSCGIPKAGKKPEKGRPNEVGSKPPGVYGLYDMAGNSWEWVADWYTKNWTKCGSSCAGIDPKGPCGGKDRCPGYRRKVVRGGSWYWESEYATGFYRRSHVPSNRPFHHFGFRCAASPEENRSLRVASQ